MASIIKCANGHYYDRDKYSSCPYCAVLADGLGPWDDMPLAGADGGHSPDKPGMADGNQRPSGGKPADDNATVAMLPPGKDQAMRVDIGPARKRKMYGGSSGDEGMTIGILPDEKNGLAYVTGWLVGQNGPVKGRDFRLHEGMNWIGSDPMSDISIGLSCGIREPRYSAVVYDGRHNAFYLKPGSGTVTFLNDEALEEAKPISPGDRIRVGNVSFEFVPYCREGNTWDRKDES